MNVGEAAIAVTFVLLKIIFYQGPSLKEILFLGNGDLYIPENHHIPLGFSFGRPDQAYSISFTLLSIFQVASRPSYLFTLKSQERTSFPESAAYTDLLSACIELQSAGLIFPCHQKWPPEGQPS